MKINMKRQALVTALAAVGIFGAQITSAAEDKEDLVYDCVLKFKNDAGQDLFVKRNSTGNLGVTKTKSNAAIFTFARDPDWSRSTTDGVSYLMSTNGRCVGSALSTPVVDAKVSGNLACSQEDSLIVRITTTSLSTGTEFTLRMKGYPGLYFTAYSFDESANILLRNKPSTGLSVRQKFYTSECRNVNYEPFRPGR